ncbi:hypothetical protein SAMN05444746_106262 [Variovorax sp. OK212]|nr:hypothetical protein SAMN05518853_106262 [Variovorax sp. OK202]SFD36104.1 hypothetical protein SAMN05444746_106262 [Variovorax sp. OK212]
MKPGGGTGLKVSASTVDAWSDDVQAGISAAASRLNAAEQIAFNNSSTNAVDNLEIARGREDGTVISDAGYSLGAIDDRPLLLADVGAGRGRGSDVLRTDRPQRYGRPAPYGFDEPGAFVDATRQAVANPPPGTSNYATDELRTKYSSVFAEMRKAGIGTTVFGTASADGFINNSYDITSYPEESLNNTSSITYHKYGLLTYLGPVDIERGITKDWVVKNVLEDRYSYPREGIVPGPANFDGKSQVYAVAPLRATAENLADPRAYTYPIGVIEQARVPDGVLNITTDDHQVYPGTIRRTVVEVDGGLFIYTSGAGENRMNNTGSGTYPGLGQGAREATVARDAAQYGFAFGNDKFGTMAFKALDQQAVQYVNSVRNTKR